MKIEIYKKYLEISDEKYFELLDVYKNKGLDFSEIGMLICFALQDIRNTTLSEIITMKKDGRTSVLTILKKLENHGFIVFDDTRKNGKLFIEGASEWQ